MQNRIKFIVYGDPKGKARPRFKRLGKMTITYTPKDTMEYENNVRESFQKEAKKRNFKKLEGAIEVNTVSVFKIPESYSNKKKSEMIGMPVLKKPDTDNIIKSVLDPLNGIAYDDDSQVCKVTGYKYYGLDPRVEVTIKQFTNAIQPIQFIDCVQPIRFL